MSYNLDYDLLNKLDKQKSNKSTSNEKSESINKSYSFDNYNLTLCTDETTNIYINVINKKTFQNYETIIKENDLDLELRKFCGILYGCFEYKKNYNFTYKLEATNLIINFSVCFDDFFEIHQSIEIKEKEFTQNKQQNAKLIQMETRIKELETEEIILGYHTTNFGDFMKFNINTEIIDLSKYPSNNYKYYGNLWEINKFKFLKKIIINDNQLMYDYQPVIFKMGEIDIKKIPNIYCNSGIWMKPSFISSTQLTNMFDDVQLYFQNVVELTIIKNSVGDFNDIKLRSLPKLKKITFKNYENTLLETFNFIKVNGLKSVVYDNCLNIKELDLIKNLFETNNYELKISK